MTSDDDRLRQALSRGEPERPVTAHETLEQLRPAMQRARLRHRVTVGASTVALLAVCGAGVLALAPTRIAPTLRTVDSDDSSQSVLPEPTTVPPTTVPPTTGPPTTGPPMTRFPDVATAPPPVVIAPEQNPAGSPTADAAAPVADDGPTPSPETPKPTTAPNAAPPPPTAAPLPAEPPLTAEQPPPVAPPPPAAPAVDRTIASDCGDVVVTIENGTVRIVSITARPGYASQVSDDGPNSIELVFRSEAETCELHAELKSGELDIEVQHPSDED